VVAGIEEHRLLVYAFADRFGTLGAGTRVAGNKVVAGTVFEPGSQVRTSWTGDFPFVRDEQGGVADIGDAVVQGNGFVDFVCWGSRGDFEGNIGGGDEGFVLREEQ
jgi:hypothetical protein